MIGQSPCPKLLAFESFPNHANACKCLGEHISKVKQALFTSISGSQQILDMNDKNFMNVRKKSTLPQMIITWHKIRHFRQSKEQEPKRCGNAQCAKMLNFSYVQAWVMTFWTCWNRPGLTAGAQHFGIGLSFIVGNGKITKDF